MACRTVHEPPANDHLCGPGWRWAEADPAAYFPVPEGWYWIDPDRSTRPGTVVECDCGSLVPTLRWAWSAWRSVPVESLRVMGMI